MLRAVQPSEKRSKQSTVKSILAGPPNQEVPKLISVGPIPKRRAGKKHVIKASHLKSPEARAQARAQKVQARTDPAHFPGQTDVEQLAVSAPVGLDYARRMQDLKTFARQQKLSLRCMQKFDEACSLYLNNIFNQGVEYHERSKFWAAVIDSHPGYGHRGMLPRTRRALQGWSKIDPHQTRPPLPWALVAALVMMMLKRKNHQPALATLLMFTAYLRPSEALMLQNKDIVRPMPGEMYHVVHLHPPERQETSL